jgi:hypothetical protein
MPTTISKMIISMNTISHNPSHATAPQCVKPYSNSREQARAYIEKMSADVKNIITQLLNGNAVAGFGMSDVKFQKLFTELNGYKTSLGNFMRNSANARFINEDVKHLRLSIDNTAQQMSGAKNPSSAPVGMSMIERLHYHLLRDQSPR